MASSAEAVSSAAPVNDDETREVEEEAALIQATTARQMERLGALNASLAKKVRKAEAEAAALLAENKDLELKNKDLREKLAAAKGELEKLEAVERELKDTYTNLSAAQADVTQLGLAVETAKAEMDTVEGDRDAALAKVEALQAELDEAAKERDLSRSDAADAADARRAAEGEVGQLKKAIVEAEAREVEAKEAGLREVEKEKQGARVREGEMQAAFDAMLGDRMREKDEEWRKRQSLLEHGVVDVLQKHRAGVTAGQPPVAPAKEDDTFDAMEGDAEEPAASRELPGPERASLRSSVLGEEVVEERVVDERDGDDVLEVVDEEVPVSQEEAASKRRALRGGDTVAVGAGPVSTGDGGTPAGDRVPDPGATVDDSAEDKVDHNVGSAVEMAQTARTAETAGENGGPSSAPPPPTDGAVEPVMAAASDAVDAATGVRKAGVDAAAGTANVARGVGRGVGQAGEGVGNGVGGVAKKTSGWRKIFGMCCASAPEGSETEGTGLKGAGSSATGGAAETALKGESSEKEAEEEGAGEKEELSGAAGDAAKTTESDRIAVHDGEPSAVKPEVEEPQDGLAAAEVPPNEGGVVIDAEVSPEDDVGATESQSKKEDQPAETVEVEEEVEDDRDDTVFDADPEDGVEEEVEEEPTASRPLAPIPT